MDLFSSLSFLTSTRQKLSSLTILLTTALFFCPITQAQVTTNPAALNQLGEEHTPQKQNSTKKAKRQDKRTKNPSTIVQKHKDSIPRKPTESVPDHSQEQQHKVEKSNVPTAPQGKPIEATIPNRPPPVPIITEPTVFVPLHAPSLPPLPIVNPKAEGKVISMNSMTILTFPLDSSDINRAMMNAAIKIAESLKKHPQTEVYLDAYSHENIDDPSTPRRLALNRGLAIRAILINKGIPATRIYLRTKDPLKEKDVNPDRVEIIRSDFMKHKAKETENKTIIH